MNWMAYELVGGKGYTLKRGSLAECQNHVFSNPRGPRGGSVHVRKAS